MNDLKAPGYLRSFLVGLAVFGLSFAAGGATKADCDGGVCVNGACCDALPAQKPPHKRKTAPRQG